MEDDINKKFALEIQNSTKSDKITLNRARRCKIHEDEVISFKCPICKGNYCDKCRKIIEKNNEGQEKNICIKCWKAYIYKTFLFFITLSFSFIIMVYFLIFNNYFN